MAFIRTFGSSLTTGKPFVAIVADEDDPTIRTVVGGRDMQGMVENRWKAYTEKGLPADHQTLLTTLGGSYTVVPDWEPAGDDQDKAVTEARRIITAGEPLPEALIAP